MKEDLNKKLRDKFSDISFKYNIDDNQDYVCMLSYLYKDVLSQQSNLTLIDFKQFTEMNNYVWQSIGLNGTKILLIFLNTEDTDYLKFYKIIE